MGATRAFARAHRTDPMPQIPSTVARRPPVIVLGMHRSGTSMLVGLLRDLGLHIGANAPRNSESKLFRRLNLWLLGNTGGHWDNPASIDRLLRLPELRAAADEYLADALSSLRAIDYLGWRRWLACRSVYALDTPWGWKDPVNTWTLPFWLDLFPQAKVVHIYRNGIDTAYSMHARTRRYFEHRYGRWQRLRALYQLRPPRKRFTSVCTWELDDCFTLWQDYLGRADAQVRALPPERTFTLQYEAFLQEPLPTLRRLARFCDLEATEPAIAAVTAAIKPERAFAFLADPDKRAFAARHAAELARWGYTLPD